MDFLARIFQEFLFRFRRRPAWTDRILSRVNTYNYEHENVQLSLEAKNYRSHPDEIYRLVHYMARWRLENHILRQICKCFYL